MNDWLPWIMIAQLVVFGSLLFKIYEILGRIERELDRQGDLR